MTDIDRFSWDDGDVRVHPRDAAKAWDESKHPRQPNGEFGSGGVDAEAVAQEITKNKDLFNRGEGEIEGPVSPDRAQVLIEDVFSMQEMMTEITGEPTDGAGYMLTLGALELAGEDEPEDFVTHVATVEGLGVAGAICYQYRSGEIEGEMMGSEYPPSIYLDGLGTTGITPGAGSALVEQAYRAAADKGVGIQGQPLEAALPFWEKMGWHEDPLDIGAQTYGLSAKEVQAVVDRLG